jgi:hypothetical protein
MQSDNRHPKTFHEGHGRTRARAPQSTNPQQRAQQWLAIDAMRNATQGDARRCAKVGALLVLTSSQQQ